MNNDFELFPGKDLAGLFKDIYNNQQTKKRRISELIFELKNKIRHVNDWITIGPLINQLIDYSIKNDDSLVKLATIAQRIATITHAANIESGGLISDEEKRQLMANINEMTYELNKETDGTDQTINKIQSDINKINDSIKKNEPKSK